MYPLVFSKFSLYFQYFKENRHFHPRENACLSTVTSPVWVMFLFYNFLYNGNRRHRSRKWRLPVKMKNQNKPPKLFWRIVISAVGAALILIAVSNLALYFFGKTVSIMQNADDLKD